MLRLIVVLYSVVCVCVCVRPSRIICLSVTLPSTTTWPWQQRGWHGKEMRASSRDSLPGRKRQTTWRYPWAPTLPPGPRRWALSAVTPTCQGWELLVEISLQCPSELSSYTCRGLGWWSFISPLLIAPFPFSSAAILSIPTNGHKSRLRYWWKMSVVVYHRHCCVYRECGVYW